METLLIFVPCALYNEEPGLLYGMIQETKEEHVKSYFIIGKVPGENRRVKSKHKQCNVVGYYYKESLPTTYSVKQNRPTDWLLLGLHGCEFILHETSNGCDLRDMSKPRQTVFIIYDHHKFMQSEFLLQSSEYNSSMYGDHFKMLANKLHSENIVFKSEDHTFSTFIFNNIIMRNIIQIFLFVLNFLLNCVHFMNPVLKYTTLGLHLQMFLRSLIWVLQSSVGKEKLSVKVGNYVVAIIVDVCSGLLLLYWLIALKSSPTALLLESGEVVVRSLRELLHWLMGIPAGLKLNYAFNNMLGRFFLYHINLWWTFLVVAKPLLEVTFHIFLCLGRLGLTFQASILADLLALVSFHIYCIYVYAARLYNLQVSGLVALWRLFLGRKRNPLRGRVDSCQYSPDQLFVGTLAFTILLFLLPTTFMYYIVFTSLRLVVIGLGGLLTRVRYVLQCLPLYVSTLWLLRSTAISSTIHLTVRVRETEGPLLLSVQPVSGSWWKTVHYCMPEPVHPPPKVEWGNLIRSLVSGKLIYPV
ncbi:phosphatidylinositol N-acetylglucosaminyltransferase subunit Q [Periplaneta americana]|uniref:phosphatidylinositol N-acetylglucosaminyltransferase subunit Q n=1 Tax=Periplaneta americana TaxID=6978 RepID=UPI0037E85A36